MSALQPMLRILTAVVLLVLLVVPGQAYDEVKLKDAERLATLLQAQLRGVAGRIDNGTLQDDALAAQRVTLEKIRAAASVGAENAAGPLGEISKQVEGLGPPPAAGEPEAEVIAKQRKDLNAQLVRATAAQKQFVLVGLEAEQVMARATDLQRNQFLQRIFKADRSALNPVLWKNTWDGAGILASRAIDVFNKGRAEFQGRFSPGGLLLIPIAVGALWLLFFRLLPKLFAGRTAVAEDQDMSGLDKLWHVILSYLRYVLTVVVLVMIFLAAFDLSGVLTPSIDNLLQRLLDAVQPALLFGGLLYFVVSPAQPKWRLLAVDNAASRTLVVLVVLAYLAYGFGDEVSAFATSVNLPVSFAVGQTAASALMLIVLLAAGLVIVRRQAAKGLATEGGTYFFTWFLNFMPVWWVLLGIAAMSLLFGFIALSYFIAGNMLDTAMLAVVIGLLHAFTDALATALNDPHSRSGHALRRATQWTDLGIQRLVLVLRTIVEAVLVIVGLLALVALWTVVLFDIKGYLAALGQGIRIGSITLSPSALATAAAVLVVGATITKYVSRWLDRRVLSQTQLDKGVQDSLRAVASYSGYGLAAVFALTAAGLDFSSLTLVVGALGVGIGLGLQSIVNNFVSGLIMLAERPVRVGDWVVTNAGEGIVKKINVRSTEIETFDNCTIIVPNSNLISEAVRNWTHRDSVGRFTVSVSFVHTAEVDDLLAKLQAIVQSHAKVMRHPAPMVQLSRLTPLGLEFDIRGHIRDVFDAAQVASDIRLAIARQLPRSLLSSSLPPAKEEKAAPAAKQAKAKA